MNDDYLWDKTGEPDPEIMELEQILGTLKYQPKPLELPKDVPVRRRPNYFAWIAIAASVLLAIIAGSIWLRVRTNHEASRPQEAKVVPPTRVEEKVPVPAGTVEPKPQPVTREGVVAVHKHRPRPSAPVLSKQEREEALVAKEQLMLALRLTTEKLSLVHKKTQTINPANQIKNQHRVG